MNLKRPLVLEKTQIDSKGFQLKPNLLHNRALELSESKASLRYVCLFSCHSTLVGLTVARLTNVQENLEGQIERRETFEIAVAGLTLVRLTSVQENRGGRPDASGCGQTNARRFGVHLRVRNRVKSSL